MYQAGGTIKTLMEKVAKNDYILPAIQREFVWKPEQICRLFDSILQGYPFGTFLFWKIKPEHRSEYQFYDFVKDYHQRDNPHCNRISELPEQEFVAVLDGQQRITALNIGLRGSYSWKLSGKRWSNNNAFPERKLYLNLLGKPEDEAGTQYEFEFLTEDKLSDLDDDDNNVWFLVSKILQENIDDLTDELDDTTLNKGKRKQARDVVRQLYRAIHDKDKISYYEEENQELERVLNIFIRMNSGGTPLSYSDLLLSIAIAQWSSLDAREEIHSLVDKMNNVGNGFNFSKDLVLKAGLMLSDIGSVGFKVENFNKDNMAKLEKKWADIKAALMLATELLATFGFNSQNLKADSVLLPVAYYLYYRNLNEIYLYRSEYVKDRSNLHNWLVRSLLKTSGIWGSGLDTLLTVLRKTIVEHGRDSFPVEEIDKVMAARGKSLFFSEEEIAELSEIEYGNKRTFTLLSVLFPGFDFSHYFHVDHIFPKAQFSKIKLRGLRFAEDTIDELIGKSNRLPNLQLLEGSINNEKRQKMPHDWYALRWPNDDARRNHLQAQAIDVLPETLNGFESFYDSRRKILSERISLVLNR